MDYVYDKKTLFPVNINRDNYDEVAADFLVHYGCAQYLTTPMPVPIFDIARKRLGLIVDSCYRLSEENNILGIIAFLEGDVEVFDAGLRDYISIKVKQGTVLIDTDINHEGRQNNTVAHECIHYHIHRQYFLRKEKNEKKIGFRCPVHISKIDKLNQDEELMEIQAHAIAPRILMPKVATRIKLQEYFAGRLHWEGNSNRKTVLLEVVSELASFFHVSKESAKYRMVDLGFMTQEEAEKISQIGSSPTDVSKSVNPLSFISSRRSFTRNISVEQAFQEYSDNDAFKELLQSGLFHFLDGVFVIRDQKYLQSDKQGTISLTPYALENPQECILLFEYRVLKHISPGMLQPGAMGRMTRDKTEYRKVPRYYPNVQNDIVFDNAKMKEKAQKNAFENIRDEFGRYMNTKQAVSTATSFWERVEQIRKAKGFSKRKLKELSGMDDQTVSRLSKGSKVTLRNGIAACFGLDLDVSEAKELLSLGQLALGKDKESLAYEYVLSAFQGCSLDERNEVLSILGIQTIGVRSKDKE